MAQLVKDLPAMWETQARSLGWEDPLEKGTASHSSILAWRETGAPVGEGAASLGRFLSPWGCWQDHRRQE